MAENSSYQAEIQALREELGELQGILTIPEVRDVLKRVGKKEEEVEAGPMLPPSFWGGNPRRGLLNQLSFTSLLK